MTLPSTPRRAGPFNGNDSATSFAFTFKVFSDEDIRVVRAASGVEYTLTLDSDYSVTLNGDQEANPGGSITYPLSGDPLATGETLTAAGALEYDQPADIPDGGNFNPTALENELDRIVMQIQQLAEENERGIRLALSSVGVSTELPVPQANQVIAWNPAGTALVNRDTPLTTDMVAAGNVEVTDAGGYFTAATLEAVLQEMANDRALAQNGQNLLRQVPPAEWGGILAGTSTYNVTSILNAAFASGHWFMPRGRWRTTSKVTLQRNASLSCSPGAVLYPDFTSWTGAVTVFEVAGLGGTDVGNDTQTRIVENLLIKGTGAAAVQATAFSVPNGATGPDVLQSAYQMTLRNIMVDGFDRGYYLGQLRESELWGIKARNVRVGVEVRGKCIGCRFYGLNLFVGTPATSSVADNYGVIIDSYNIAGADRGSGSEERPEDINFFGGAIVGFDINIDAVRALLVKVDGMTMDSEGVNINHTSVDGLNVTRNWIASQGGAGKGIVCNALASPVAAPMTRIAGNEFNNCTYGIEALTTSGIHIEHNKFDESSLYDVYFSGNVSSSRILNNRSKSSPAVSIFINACAELDIDGNESDGAVCVYVHPSNANTTPPTANSLRIGKNKGSTHVSYETGFIDIAAGATTATLTLTKWSTASYLAPRVSVVSAKEISGTGNPGYVNVRETSTFTTYELAIAAPAAAGGVRVTYRVEARWFGDL